MFYHRWGEPERVSVDRVIGIKLLDSMMEEPVAIAGFSCRALLHAAGAGVRVIGADEAC